jgi:hypothetical protein
MMLKSLDTRLEQVPQSTSHIFLTTKLVRPRNLCKTTEGVALWKVNRYHATAFPTRYVTLRVLPPIGEIPAPRCA